MMILMQTSLSSINTTFHILFVTQLSPHGGRDAGTRLFSSWQRSEASSEVVIWQCCSDRRDFTRFLPKSLGFCSACASLRPLSTQLHQSKFSCSSVQFHCFSAFRTLPRKDYKRHCKFNSYLKLFLQAFPCDFLDQWGYVICCGNLFVV